MSNVLENHGRQTPFDAVAHTYDETFSASCIGRAQRGAVTEELDSLFFSGQRILELNCGTGIDAAHLAQGGVLVTACDSSSRMIEIAERRAQLLALHSRIQFRLLANEKLGSLLGEKKESLFDGAFSNFAGLNCATSIPEFISNLARLLKPRAKALICVFGKYCVWETLWYVAHGNLKKAFRRWGSGSHLAQIADGVSVEVHYPTAGAWTRLFDPHFRLAWRKGIGVAVPPTFVEPLACRFPRALEMAANADRWMGRRPGFRSLADHILFCFERR